MVLDPACGCGNFLYVSLEHLKRLEGEVLDVRGAFGESFKLELETHSVDPHQFLGLEINPRAAAITELVLWIGYLQWHFRTRGQTMPAEPVLKKFKNIECRDAVLAYDGTEPARDEGRADYALGREHEKDPVTGENGAGRDRARAGAAIPESPAGGVAGGGLRRGESAVYWHKRMREALGDGYAEAMRASSPDVQFGRLGDVLVASRSCLSPAGSATSLRIYINQ